MDEHEHYCAIEMLSPPEIPMEHIAEIHELHQMMLDSLAIPKEKFEPQEEVKDDKRFGARFLKYLLTVRGFIRDRKGRHKWTRTIRSRISGKCS